MNTTRLTIILVLSILLLTAAANFSQEARVRLAPPDPAESNSPLPGRLNAPSENEAAVRARLEVSFGQLPLLFVENQGQWDEQVDYAIQGADKTLYFTSEGVTFALTAPITGKAESGRPDLDDHFTRWIDQLKQEPYERWAVKLDFVGANPNVQPIGQEKDQAVISYFKGRPEEWHTGLPTYRRLVYEDLWPGIDLVYEGTVNRLKYHFVVQPGADPGLIRLTYRGAKDVSLNAGGALVVETPLGSFQDDAPLAYQEVGDDRVPVAMAYVLESAGPESQPYHFELGLYDPSLPLILDPAVLVYAGYIGGNGRDHGEGIAVDGSGNVYVTGGTYSNEATFPVTVGPDLTFNGGDWDAFVVKVNPAGTGLVYAGYIGGSSEDFARGIALDSYGNAYVTGYTESTEATFPVAIGPDLSYNGGDRDAFVAKVNPAGTGLVYAGYIGGNGYEYGMGIAVDGFGNAYVIGFTESDEATFPVTTGPDLTHNGGFDAFVTKVNPAGAGLTYSGYIGGSSEDDAWGIALDSSGNAYITGLTNSDEITFPVNVGPDLTFNGGFDAFVAKVNTSGTGLDYVGYVGGSGWDIGHSIGVNGFGNAYITGSTLSDEATFPVTAGPDLTHNGDLDAFAAKVNPSGTGLVYAGYIGGGDSDVGYDIAVDGSGNAYVIGFTESDEATFPVTVGPDLTFNGGRDAFVAKVYSTGAGLGYAGYIGGGVDERGHSIAVDMSGNAYVTGYTDSNEATFPVTTGPDLTYNGSWDAFVAKVVVIQVPPANLEIVGADSGLIGTTYHVTATTSPITTTIPLTYVWQATGQPQLTHTGGLTDTAGFNWGVSGSKHITVTVSNDFGVITNTHMITLYTPVQAGLTANPTEGIAPLTVAFTNTSTGDFETSLWDFGDSITSTVDNPTHTYGTSGVYTVTLVVDGLGGTDIRTRVNYIEVDPYETFLPLLISPY